MQELIDRFQNLFTGSLPQLLIALGILVAGWILALVITAIFKALLKRTTIDNKIAAWVKGEKEGELPEVEGLIGRVVFWLLMIFVLVAFFSYLGFSAVTGPLETFLNEIFDFLPQLLSAAALLLVAWLVATGLRFAVTRALAATGLDERLARQMADEEEAAQGGEGEAEAPKGAGVSLSKTLGDTVYWLVFLFFLPAILDALSLEGLLGPVNELVGKVLAYLPNLLGALLIFAIGWLLARVVQRVVTNLLAAVGADRLGERVGAERVLGERHLSGLLGFVVYLLILIPVAIAALERLGIEAIAQPATDMLDQVLQAVPLLFGAAVLLLFAYFVGRLVSGLVATLLAGIGFDGVFERLGVTGGEAAADERGRKPSELVGLLVMVAVMLFATIEALRLLEFEQLAAIVSQFTVFAGDVLLGVVIFGVGFYLANLAAEAIRSSSTAQAGVLALFARAAILVLAGAMALRQAGLAEDIINLAFGLLLGAIAVAAAIAFGIGGRDLAARYLERWSGKLEKEGGSGQS